MRYTFTDIKSSKEQLHSWTYMFILKPFVIFFTWIFANLRISPDVINVLGIAPNLVSGYFHAMGHPLLGSFFYLIAWLFDAIDGRVARVRGLTSKYGAFLDNYMGNVGFIFMFIGFFYGLAKAYNSSLILLLGIFVFFAINFHSWMSLKVKSLVGDSYAEKITKAYTHGKEGVLATIMTKLKNRGLVEPFNTIDLIVLIFIVGPFIEFFYSGTLLYMVLGCLVVIFLKEIIWFKYYKKILKN